MAIKVLHVIKSLGRGGAEMLLPETLRLHRRDKFEFHYVYFLPWKDQMVRSLREGGGKVTCLEASNNLQIMTKAWALAHYVRENKIQLIHAHLPWAGLLAKAVGKMTNVPTIYTEHNKLERYHFGTRVLNVLSMNVPTMVIAVSNDVSISIQRHKPRMKVPIRTILNGVNVERFRKELFDGRLVRERLGIPGSAPVVGTIAVFRFQKRLDLWMDVASKILRRNKDVHFIIVGDGPLRTELLQKRMKLGLTDRIYMPGLETEVRPYLAAFDIFMMTSSFEGMPVALLEAMAMQLPVVSTDAGGIKEVITHMQEGLLCPVNEPEKLIDYACSLIDNQTERVDYGTRARARVKEHLSIEKMVRDLEEVYMELSKNTSL